MCSVIHPVNMDANRESGLGSDSDNMADLAALLQTEIPEGRSSLADSHTNLERVAEYCEANYFQSDNKRAALEETKNYTTQSLASVAYQINTLAYNFLHLLDLQTAQLAEMESQMNHIAQTVMIHKEKVARREIGVLTANKTSARQYKIIAPANPEKPIKYVRKPIDYTALDDIGHGVRTSITPRSKQRGPTGSGGSASSLGVLVGPAPTTKPPTPPQTSRPGAGSTLGPGACGSLGKGSREYRTPPAVAPPQVPSHYAPNYPLGHPRRGERGAGYSTLPMPPPQVGTVHPQPHTNTLSAATAGGYGQRSTDHLPPHHTLPHPHQHHPHQVQATRHLPGNVSPPLPPPPPPEQEARLRIVPDEDDLPGWVPKNYIEKVVAIYDYNADKEDELSFQESSIIYVLKKNDDGWWEGVMDGITGLFPGNYVEPCV